MRIGTRARLTACTIALALAFGASTAFATTPSCNDGNPCTDDAYNSHKRKCVHTNNSKPCNDGQLCTKNDACRNGKCSGTPFLPKVCGDDTICTTNACDPQANGGAGGCVFAVVVESPQCMSCVDGIDNDGDGDVDAEDCNCNLLCETFDYAVVAQRDSTRRTAYFGKDTHAKRGFDPVLGTPGVQAPYPLGASVASACSQGKLELVERAIIDGTGTASTRAKFGDGDQMFLGFFAGFAPPGQVMTTGIPPFVGPRALCSTTLTPCIDDSQCLPTEKCRPQMSLVDPGNPSVDLTGTHPELADCETAKGSLDVDFATLFALPPTQDLGNVRFRSGDAPIDVTGPGLHVVRLSALRVETGALLPIISDSTTEALIVQIERTLTIGVRARIELAGGLTPDRVLWLVDRRGRTYVGNQEVMAVDDDGATLPGTLLAPQKNIVVGKKARVAGALLGRNVQLNEKAVVSHRPYIAATP